MKEDENNIYKRALQREKAARKEAERILEEKSRELYFKSQALEEANLKLERLVQEKTSELKGVFENIVDAYVVMDLSGQVLKMNEAAENLLGYTLEDQINLMSLVQPSEQPKVVEGFSTLITSGSITDFQIHISIASNETRLVHINASVIYNEKNLPIAAQGIVRDITDVNAAEQKLIDSENRLSTLISSLESGVLLEDEHRNIVITNQRFCDFFGIPVVPANMVGLNCENAAEQSKDLFEDPKAFVSRINELVKNKSQVLGDELMMVDGKILERDFIPIYEEGVYKGHLWTYTDVTIKRNFRTSIEAQKEKYSNIIANMNLGLLEVDKEDRILMANHSFEKMSGYSQEFLKGKKAANLLLDDTGVTVIQNENKSREKGHSNSYEVQAKTKDGKIKHWLISGAPNFDIQGNQIGSIGIHLDITELKSLEEQKEALLKELARSNDELQEYAHVVSHDLKSPLRSINALVNWIKDDNAGKLDDETTKNLELIDSTLEKMEHLISDVLQYSSVTSEAKVFQDVPVVEVLHDIIEILHIPEHITVTIPEDLPVIKADKVKIQQLFQNLISNSVRYNDKEQGIISIGYKDASKYHQFSVSDNGVGIKKEYHEKIFKIFQSLNKSKESSGIGLTIVKKIIDIYKGDIWLESEPGKGTTFYFTIAK